MAVLLSPPLTINSRCNKNKSAEKLLIKHHYKSYKHYNRHRISNITTIFIKSNFNTTIHGQKLKLVLF